MFYKKVDKSVKRKAILKGWLFLLCALALKENHLLCEWWAAGYTVKKL